MAPGYDVRMMRDWDANNVLILAKKFHAESPYKHLQINDISVLKSLRASIAAKLAVLATSKEGRVVGFAIGQRTGMHFCPAAPIGAELGWYVLPEHRSSGVGRKLLSVLEAAARAAGLEYWVMSILSTTSPDSAEKALLDDGYVEHERGYIKRL